MLPQIFHVIITIAGTCKTPSVRTWSSRRRQVFHCQKWRSLLMRTEWRI